jgi:MFS family permease
MLNPINTTMISVALVPISAALGIGSAAVIWLVVGLYITTAISQPIMGVLADHIGPRTTYLAGLIIVICSSVIPLVSPTFRAVLVSRIILGVGAAAAYPAAMTLIRHQTKRLGVATPPALLAALSITSLTTAAIGPVLGGVLILTFGWVAIFAVNIPIAGLALILALSWLPSDKLGREERSPLPLSVTLDLFGMGVFAAAITTLLLFLLDLRFQLWWLLAASLMLFALLVFWEVRRDRPFIDVRLLVRNGGLTRTYLRLFLTYLGSYVVVYAMSQWLQDNYGLSSSEAGLVQLPSALLAGLASFSVARTVKVRLPLILAAVIAVGGGVLLASIGSLSPLWLIVIAASLFGITQGLASVSNQVVVYRMAPPEQIGSASGLSRTSVSLTAITASSLICVIFGQAPSDSGLNTLGWIVTAAALAAVILTVADKTLKSKASLY